MIYMTLLPEWPRGSGTRLFWAGWYASGCGVPSAAATSPCPFTALADMLDRVSPPSPTKPRERGLFE